MDIQNNSEKFDKKPIFNAVWKTVAVLVLLVLLIGLIWSIAVPASAGSFFYSVGLKKLSAKVSVRAANESVEIKDYYTAFVRANDAKSYKYVTYCAEAMLLYDGDDSKFTSAEYASFVSDMDKELGVPDTSTDQFVSSRYIYSKMRVKNCADDDFSIFGKAKELCKGTSIYYFYNSVCPITNYINAIIDTKNADIDVVYRVVLEMRLMNESLTSAGVNYWRTNKDDTLNSSINYDSAQASMKADVNRLLEAKNIDRTAAEAYAQTKGAKYLNAFVYWSDIINQQ